MRQNILGEIKQQSQRCSTNTTTYDRSGVAAKDNKQWKFQAHMKYLLHYIVNEKRDTNFTGDSNRSDPSEEEPRF